MNTDDRTPGEMFAELSREARTLVQQELQLAKTELSEKRQRWREVDESVERVEWKSDGRDKLE